MPVVDAIVAANRFIELGNADGNPIDPMKLQKLVYIAHGWSLAEDDSPLIREQVEAWPYGPVVPSLYSAFKSYRSANIEAPVPVPPVFPQIDNASGEVVNRVWGKYGHWTAIQLSMLTHEQGYAWDLARKAAEPWNSSPIIPNSFIRDEFLRRRLNHSH